MGGGALMTPALIFLGVGDAATVVTADLTAAADLQDRRRDRAQARRLTQPRRWPSGWSSGRCRWPCSAPTWSDWLTDADQLDSVLKLCIGFALLLAAATYALRLYVNLRACAAGTHVGDDDPTVRSLPTLLVGTLGGLLVGITSVGSGSVIMIALLMLYPGLSAVKLVGTDLVQAVPLVLAAAISNIALHGLDWGVLIPLLIGSVPGTILGSRSRRGCRSRSSAAASWSS